MRYTVIAISRTLGAGGEGLGEQLADELGYRYVDAEILDRAAALARVTPDEIARAEERSELVARVVASLGEAADSPSDTPEEVASAGYEQLIVDVIRETAAMEFVVIVAHGASIPLAGQPGLLRLLVTASDETRAARVSAELGITLAEAYAAIRDSDDARAAFFRKFFDLAVELPTHYDLVVNTDVLGIEEAAAVVKAAAIAS